MGDISRWDGVSGVRMCVCMCVPFFMANATACSFESKEMVMLDRGSPLHRRGREERGGEMRKGRREEERGGEMRKGRREERRGEGRGGEGRREEER